MKAMEPDPRPIRWTTEEYWKLAEAGVFSGRRVELIGGEIVEMSPANNPHVAGVALALNALQAALRSGYWPRIQATLDLSPNGCPDPDVAVVPGAPRDYVGRPTPTSAVLVIEVADTTLRYDRGDKMSLYAAAGIADYWVVNIPDQQLEVYRRPVADATQPFGFRYDEVTVLRAGDNVSPLAAPAASVPVADLIP